MLQYEDVLKVKVIKIEFKDKWFCFDYITSYLETLGFSKIKKRFGSCKRTGISFDDLISALLVLPIVGLKTIHSLTKSNIYNINITSKDSYYRLLINQHVNWRGIFNALCKRILN